jgi:hypothetical protein
MGTDVTMKRIAEASPGLKASIAGVFYLLTILMGVVVPFARGRSGLAGDLGALLVALAIGAGLMTYGFQAANSQTGLRDGMPAGFYLFFGSVALLSAAGDVRVRVRDGVFGAHRIARHLWRMCFALLIAALSFFLGQQKTFPASLRGSNVLYAPPTLVLIMMLFWLVRVLFTNAY